MSRPLCEECGIRPKQTSGRCRRNPHQQKYRRRCKTCEKHPNLRDKARQTKCSLCHRDYLPIQLDIDHVDGDRSNEAYENLEVICSNCHRLKTHINKDYIEIARRS